MERMFRRAAYVVVAVWPINVVCVLAGATKMRPLAFFSLNITGTLVRIGLIFVIGDLLEDPIRSIVSFITDYQWYLTGITFTLVAVTLVRQGMRGHGACSRSTSCRRSWRWHRPTRADREAQVEGGATSPTARERRDRIGTTTENEGFVNVMESPCSHLHTIRDVTPSSTGCEDCLRIGGTLGAPAALPAVRTRRVL